MNLVEEVMRANAELTAAIDKLKDNGVKLAEAEKEYKIILRQKALEQKASGMAVTLINKIIYGIPEVAEKRMQRDIAQTIYKTNLEYINVKKINIRVLENQLQREWGNSK